MSGWTSPLLLLRDELVQRQDEGCTVPPELRARIDDLHADRDGWRVDVIEPLHDALMALPEDAALAAREPNDLDAIRAQRPDGPRRLRWSPSHDELAGRLHAALSWRAAGCALGKPVEGAASAYGQPLGTGRRWLRAHLQAQGDWPLRDYFRDAPGLWCPLSHRERIAFMEPDDDINYTLAGLGVLEQCGPDFTWSDVARWWMRNIPIGMVCTAETQALLTFLNHTSHARPGPATAELTRRHRNPYREWIGAQIRSDGWAWACAGKPELAAEMAWRDAHWTHERSGIHGAMFLAAMQAAAFVVDDPHSLVRIGLSEIPADCRLGRAVCDCLRWAAEESSFEGCMERVEEAFRDQSPVHAIDNALVCVVGLLYGGMDPTTSVTTTVMCGLDTDCNGASVGSIVGATHADTAAALVGRLNDTIRSGIACFAEVRMSDLAERWARVWHAVDAAPVAA